MQSDTKKISAGRVCVDLLKNEGPQGFFKGIMQPLIGSTPYNTMVFSVTESSRFIMRSWDIPEKRKSLYSGMLAGGLSLAIYNPFELLKCRAQIYK
mmetsp:Transcript_35360/g.25797  ORF Transcript_35360/g.25797 Transcript_35360/m.25797 type:complete len:96 (-) Transcript_35360:525-812(-)